MQIYVKEQRHILERSRLAGRHEIELFGRRVRVGNFRVS
jgi:hypothetical protein